MRCTRCSYVNTTHYRSPVLLLMLLDDWRQRHAALKAISVLGEGCVKQITAMLEELLDMILPFCQDKVTLVFIKLLLTIVIY